MLLLLANACAGQELSPPDEAAEPPAARYTTPAAFVSLSDTAKGLDEAEISERIIAHCREKLADFKVPRSVHIVDEFPRSTLDRIAKNKLREQLPEIESG